jgi:thiosulfate/3-mercaptopyruvate sulfurtransferase
MRGRSYGVTREDHHMLMVEIADLSTLPSPVLFVDARIEADYQAGHIPGAIHHDTFDYANDLTDGEHLDEVVADWHRLFCEVGVPRTGSVVFYDVGTENRSSRPAFMLHYLGHENSYVLHGGMTAWIDSGGDISVERTTLPPASWEPLDRSARDDIVAGVDGVISRLGDREVVLLDVRDQAEFMGERRMEANPRLGRIPGAQGFEWTRFLTRRRDYPPEAGTSRNDGYVLEYLRPSEEVRSELATLGITDLVSEVIIYCQKSHRASLAYLAMKQLGYTNMRVYVGSFREWSKRLDLPIES